MVFLLLVLTQIISRFKCNVIGAISGINSLKIVKQYSKKTTVIDPRTRKMVQKQTFKFFNIAVLTLLFGVGCDCSFFPIWWIRVTIVNHSHTACVCGNLCLFVNI